MSRAEDGAAILKLSEARDRKAGRLLAINLLKEMRQRSATDAYCIEPKYRDGKEQDNAVLRYMREVQRADNADLVAGFASVLTDFIGGAIDGGVAAPEMYEDLESKRGGAA